jgi:hypothetical protein
MWSFGTQICNNGQPSHGGDRKAFEVITDTIVLFTFILSYKIATIDNSPTFAIDIHKLKETFVSQQTKSASRLIITYKCNYVLKSPTG